MKNGFATSGAKGCRRRLSQHDSAVDKHAFTLIEVLIVVAIIALLLAILLPALNRARRQAGAVVCLGNLHQIATTTQAYTAVYSSFYPPSHDTVTVPAADGSGDRQIDYGWDITRITDLATGMVRVLPGLIWLGKTTEAIQQCPGFTGPAMWADDRYTGYNYNSSYVGAFRKRKEKAVSFGPAAAASAVSWSVVVRPARQDEIRMPSLCALFGDGQYVAGANKFMRSPWGSEQGARDTWVNTGRGAGTQGYRHNGRTNVAFADGHARPWNRRYTETYELEKPYIGDNNGFLSSDNSLYDLR
ncbi:MAG: prepilin-type N-terminal cleavage/methylation domain-containing protein [Phycisphaerae bacterium]